MAFDWQSDSQAVYFVGGKDWSQPYRYDVTTAIAEPLSPPEGSDLGEIRYDSDLIGGWRSPDGERFIRQVRYTARQRVPEGGGEVVFKLPSMEYLGRQDYYAQECDNGQAFSVDHTTFTCNTTGDVSSYYRFDEPKVVAGEAPMRWIIQEGRWFMKENGRSVTRLRQAEEDSPLPALRYLYKTKSTNMVDPFGMYISQNLRDGYNSRDFSSFFPPLPTPEIYWESAHRQLEQQNKGANGG